MITFRELDRRQFFQPVVETISLTLGLPACIWLADETGDVLRITAATGLSDDYIRNAFLRLDESIVAADVFAEDRTIVVPEIAADDHWKYKDEAAAMGLKSAISVPLRVKKKIVGVLDVYTREIRDFSNFEKELIESYAAQVAVTQRRIQDLATLNEVSLLIGSELHRADLFQCIVQAAERVLDCEHVSIFLRDRNGDLVLKAASSPGIARQRFAPGEGLAGWVAQTKRSELVPDAVNHPKFVPGLSSDIVERSMVLAPIILEDEVIGVISADMAGLSGFDEHDQMLLEAVASQAAVAVRNARLLEQATSRAKVLQRLHQIGGQILSAGLSAHGLREVLCQVARSARSVLGADLVDVYQYIEVEDRCILPPILEGKRRDPFAFKDHIFDDYLVARVVKGGQPIYAPDAQIDSLLSDLFTVERPERLENRFIVREGILSSAAVLLKVVGEIVGVMFVNYRTRQDFSSEQREIIELFANQAAIAIYNARVYEQIQTRIKALKALNEVGQTLTSGIRLREEEVLELIHSQASRLMDTNNMYIALYDEATDTVRFGLAFVDGRRADIGTEGGWQPRKAGKGKAEEVIRTKEPLFHATRAETERWYAQPGRQQYIGEPLASWLGVPMVVGEKMLGVIAAYHPTRDYVYSSDDLEILQTMANQAAIALDNARLYEEARSEAIAAKQLATLGTAIAALQHRINNTFNIIVPNVTRLRRRVDMTNETIAEILDIIERNARYTSDIIARIQEPLREIESQDIDPNAVLSDVVGKVREQWQADPVRSTIEVTLDLDNSIPQIRAPIGQVAEVFRNLVDNTYRAMKAGGQLVVTSRLTDGEICVRVQDTGPGIPPRIQERLFVRPVPSREPGGGPGLGLWLSRLILQSIGGDITIEKSDPTGTTMLVRIPTSGAGKGLRP